MSEQYGFRGAALLSVFVLASACGDDDVSGGGEWASIGDGGSDMGEATPDEGGDNEQGDDNEQGGDGDGDESTGDGDGDGDGDGSTGDGDGDGSTGDGDGDGSTGDGDGEPGDNCEESEGLIQVVPPSVMLLLDRSGSMNTVGFDLDDPDKTRWNALYESVEAVLGDGADADIAFGAKTFSTWNYGECGVSDDPDVAIAIANGPAILAGIPGPLEFIVGGTPTNLAIEKTRTIMQTYDAKGGSKIVFLLTDGGLGCTDDPPQALADAVAALSGGFADDKITTYVVGIAPSNSNTVTSQLHAMAIAGGAPKAGPEAFYRADDAQQLADALAAIVAESYGKSCVMNLEQPPPFPEFTIVLIGDEQFALVDDCDSEDGFVYENPDLTQIRVCGAACELLQTEQFATVQFFCNPN